MSVTGDNPNATLATLSGSIGTIVSYVIGLTSWNVPTTVIVAGAGLFTSFVLLLGRNGLKGICKMIWRGRSVEPPAAP